MAFKLLKELCAECETGKLSALRSRVELSDQMRPTVVLALLDCIDKADALAATGGGPQAYLDARQELDRLLAYWRVRDDSPQPAPPVSE